MILPDYKNSIKNISATFSKFLGKEDGTTLEILEKELDKDYKNVVFMIFDGMGNHVLDTLGKGTIMHENIVTKVTSVFPSTTTNATTTLLTNTLVDSHKYLAWSMYFKNINRCVDIYLGCDSYTRENVSDYLNTDTTPYYQRFTPNRKICSVFPSFSDDSISDQNIIADTIEEFENAVITLCNSDEKKFVYCYHTEPDSTMHEFGVNSQNAKNKIIAIDKVLRNIVANTKDTLIVITADHGHIDVNGYIDLYKDSEIMDCLARPMSLEPRATSFKLKPGKECEFIKLMEKYKEDIMLVKSDKLIKKGVFGKNVDEELRDYLGDYIGIGTDTFKIVNFHSDKLKFKGHHTSLTEEEMFVPLIFLKSER